MSQKQQNLRNSNLNSSVTNQMKKSTPILSTNSNIEQTSTFGQFMISNKKPISTANTTTNSNNNDAFNNNNDTNNNNTNNGNLSNNNTNTNHINSSNNINNNVNNNNNNSNSISGSLNYNVINNSVMSPTQSSPNLILRDNRRVSFHDEENNVIMTQQQQQQQSGDQAEMSIVREDPNVGCIV